jgi:hypothetical protein
MTKPFAVPLMIFFGVSILAIAALTFPIAADGDWFLLWITVPAALIMGTALVLEIRDYHR